MITKTIQELKEEVKRLEERINDSIQEHVDTFKEETGVRTSSLNLLIVQSEPLLDLLGDRLPEDSSFEIIVRIDFNSLV